MKIAIMTQPPGNNYGGIMQAWALRLVLTHTGHETVTSDRQPDPPAMACTLARIFYSASMEATGNRMAPVNFERLLPVILQRTRCFIYQHITAKKNLGKAVRIARMSGMKNMPKPPDSASCRGEAWIFLTETPPTVTPKHLFHHALRSSHWLYWEPSAKANFCS